MAGDLYIENLTSDELDLLAIAGGCMIKVVFHGDKSWEEAHLILEQRLLLPAPRFNNRTGLPPHAYVEFPATTSDRDTGDANLQALIGRLRRPLGVVLHTSHFADWNTKSDAEKVACLTRARNKFCIEFYKLDGISVKEKLWVEGYSFEKLEDE